MRSESPGWYVVFDGIEQKLATHSAAVLGLAGTVLNCVKEDSIDLDRKELDRAKYLINLGGFGFQLIRGAEVESLLRCRGGLETGLGAALSRTATTLTLASGSATYANGSTVYLDRETITLGTHTGAGTYTGCTRAAHGSDATEHAPSAIISDIPRHWVDRRAVLYRVDIDTGVTTAEASGYISDDLKLSIAGVFSIKCAGIIAKLNRELLSGFDEVRVVGEPTASTVLITGLGQFDSVDFEVEDARQVAASPTQRVGFVLVTAGESWGVFRVRDGEIDDANNIVRLARPDKVAGPLALSVRNLEGKDITIKQVQFLRDRISRIAVQLLLSSTGDLSNDATWDVLPGRAPTSDDMVRKTVGCGLPPSWVDTDSFGAMLDETISVIIDEPIRVMEFLKNEILWRAGGCIYATNDGQIAFSRYKPYSVRGAISAFDGDADSVNPFEVHEAETRLLTRGQFECNYIPGDGFRGKQTVAFTDSEPIYGDRSVEVALKSKSVWVGPLPPYPMPVEPVSMLVIAARFDRERARTQYGGRLFRFRAHLGNDDGFTVLARHGLSRSMPDLRGGTLSNVTAEVVSRKLVPSTMQTEVEAEEVPRGWKLAPSAEVESYDAGSLTITLRSSGVLGDGTMFDDDPGEDFIARGFIDHFDASAGSPLSFAARLEVSSVTASTIVLNSAPATAPATGDIVQLALSDDAGVTNEYGADVLDHAFAADTNNQIGAGGLLTAPENGPRLA